MRTALAVLLIASTAGADQVCSPGATCQLVLGPARPVPALAVAPVLDMMPLVLAQDAPVRDLDEPGRALILEQGDIAPFAGVLLDEQEDVRRERARVTAEVTVKKAEEGVLLPRPAFIAIVLGCAAASAAIAAGVTAYALKKP